MPRVLTVALGAAVVAGVAPASTDTADVAKEVRSLLAAQAGPFWIRYTVPARRPASSCCWISVEEAGQRRGGCRVEGAREGAFVPVEPIPLEGGERLRVLLRGEGGRVTRIRAFSEDCALDAGGLPFFRLEGVKASQSVALLSSLEDRDVEGALAALALHADPAADAALERFIAPDQPEERRRQAAFWLGNARGARGLAVMKRLLRDDADPQFRGHVVFAVSQNEEPDALDELLEAARRDPSAHVRGQALFWLAQKASHRAGQAIRGAIDDDPEIEVKKKAVFALSQLPRDEGVPILIDLARTHRRPEVRKQAMFWLGQSRDPRALAFFEEVLRR